MKATLDIPDEALAEIESRFDKEDAPAEGIPVHMIVNWTRDGVLSAHFLSFVRIPWEDSRQSPPFHPTSAATRRVSSSEPPDGSDKDAQLRESLDEIRKRWPWVGLAADGIRHDVSHNWADIRQSIEKGCAAEFAEKERRLFAEVENRYK